MVQFWAHVNVGASVRRQSSVQRSVAYVGNGIRSSFRGHRSSWCVNSATLHFIQLPSFFFFIYDSSGYLLSFVSCIEYKNPFDVSDLPTVSNI